MIVAASASLADPPHVDLLVDALPAGTAKVSIFRSYSGTRLVIRDANQAPTGGSTSRPYQDYDVPFGVEITYSAYATNSAGAQLAVASSAAVTVPPPDKNVVWISDPLAPGTAMAVVPLNESLEDLTHTTPGDFGDVLESPLPVALMGTTQEVSAVQLEFKAPAPLIRFGIEQVLLSANPFLLRVSPDAHFGVPGLLYIAHSEYHVVKIYGDNHRVRLTGTAVAPPVSPVVIQTRTYGDVRDEASNYGDLPVMRPSYLELLRGY